MRNGREEAEGMAVRFQTSFHVLFVFGTVFFPLLVEPHLDMPIHCWSVILLLLQ
jgi:hypothetical protein